MQRYMYNWKNFIVVLERLYQNISVCVPADGRQRVEGYWSGSVTVYV